MRINLSVNDLGKWMAYGPCRVLSVFGANTAATDRYVLFFEAPSVAASDSAAVKGLYFPAGTSAYYGESTLGSDGYYLSQLFLAISTSPQIYTAPGATGDLTLTVEIDTAFPVAGSIPQLIGDLTTGVANLSIWAEASGPKHLFWLEVNNLIGQDVYAIIQASDAASTTDNTLPPIKVPAGNSNKINFGAAGLSPIRNDAGTKRQGCVVRFVVTPTIPYTFIATTDFNVRGVYV